MSDQLVLDLDGYCPTAPATSATSGSGTTITNNGGYAVITGGNTNVVGGTITSTNSSPLWYPVQYISSGTLTGTTPTVIGIDYAAKPVVPKEKNKDGCTCKKCQEFFPYAESNQSDGSLICYGCKLWM